MWGKTFKLQHNILLIYHDSPTADPNLNRTRLNTISQVFLGYFLLNTFIDIASFPLYPWLQLLPSPSHQSPCSKKLSILEKMPNKSISWFHLSTSTENTAVVYPHWTAQHLLYDFLMVLIVYSMSCIYFPPLAYSGEPPDCILFEGKSIELLNAFLLLFINSNASLIYPPRTAQTHAYTRH